LVRNLILYFILRLRLWLGNHSHSLIVVYNALL
jgi:hypothetical protein